MLFFIQFNYFIKYLIINYIKIIFVHYKFCKILLVLLFWFGDICKIVKIKKFLIKVFLIIFISENWLTCSGSTEMLWIYWKHVTNFWFFWEREIGLKFYYWYSSCIFSYWWHFAYFIVYNIYYIFKKYERVYFFGVKQWYFNISIFSFLFWVLQKNR